jgi:capsular polysaccharide biosynthesis protein
MEEKNKTTEETTFSLVEFYRAIKRYFVLILAIFVAAIAVGFVYVSTTKPDFTATEKVAYKAQNELQSTTQNNINAMNAFIGTIVDFCDEGVVVDRANYYYSRYLNAKLDFGSGYPVEDFIKSIRVKDTYDSSVVSEKNILAPNISVKSEVAEKDSSKFFFYVSYKDKDAKAAVEKVKILVLAFDLETREKIVIDNEEEGKYFAGIISEIVDLDTVGGAAVSSMKKSSVMVLSGVAGILVALLVVYVITVQDKTVKDKDQLEELTGASVLSNIVKQEEKNARK